MKKQLINKKTKKRAKVGDTILLHYTARINDDKVVASTKAKQPIKVTLGKDHTNQLIENGIIGMSERESNSVTVPAEKAYGPYRKDYVFTFDLNEFKNKQPKVGDVYNLQLSNGGKVQARVIDKTESHVTIDANHILAGKDITYDIELVQIVN
ncbi:FKBP-type peptidyl-prolyl cis-trans isomerase [candidate division KSB1 bacterium]|nr:FKBP-type peptidyl-prolyl cis-trans isomerase [candidate division KSB1 bacterium]